MGKITLLAISLLIASGCGGTSGVIDQSTPEKAVESIFSAAQAEKFDGLKNLCHPEVDNDNDTDGICKLVEANHDEFINYFAQGEVAGDAEIDGDKAKVPFLFGPDGEDEETMNLIKKDGVWYLAGF